MVCLKTYDKKYDYTLIKSVKVIYNLTYTLTCLILRGGGYESMFRQISQPYIWCFAGLQITFGLLLRGQLHSSSVNPCVLFILFFYPKVKMSFMKRLSLDWVPIGVWTDNVPILISIFANSNMLTSFNPPPHEYWAQTLTWISIRTREFSLCNAAIMAI